MFHRSTGDDHAVKLFVAHFLKIAVECLHVFNRRVLTGMRLNLHQMHIQLQRRVGEQTDEVGLGGNLQGHQIEYGNAQGTDVLTVGSFIAQHKDVLVLEKIYGRKFIG